MSDWTQADLIHEIQYLIDEAVRDANREKCWDDGEFWRQFITELEEVLKIR